MPLLNQVAILLIAAVLAVPATRATFDATGIAAWRVYRGYHQTVVMALDKAGKPAGAKEIEGSAWREITFEIPADAASERTIVDVTSDAALTTEQAKVWKAVDAAIGSYTGGVMTLSGPRGIAKSAGAARWAMNRPGEIRWLRAPEAGRIPPSRRSPSTGSRPTAGTSPCPALRDRRS